MCQVEAKKAVPRDDQSGLSKSNSSAHGSPGPGRTKKIFVGGLASTVTEADFKKYFDQFGTITDVVVMYDHNTQRPRGFGFITYDSEDAVDKALVNTFHELNGKLVEVKRAVPKELSPGPTMRNPPIGGYNLAVSRANSFLSGYNPGYSPSSIGGYGMRMDGRFGFLGGGGRNGYPPISAGYGIGLNFNPGTSLSFGSSSNFSNNGLQYGRQPRLYHNGSLSRYNSSSGYGGANENSSSMFNSLSRIWGNGSLNYNTSSASSNGFMPSASGGLGGFGNNDGVNWGSSSPISAQGMGSSSEYANANLSFGIGEISNAGMGANRFERNSGGGIADDSFNVSSNGYESNYGDQYGSSSSIYGDTTWRTASSELDGPGSFGYGLGDAPSDVTDKGSAGYMGRYNVTSQTNRGKLFILNKACEKYCCFCYDKYFGWVEPCWWFFHLK